MNMKVLIFCTVFCQAGWLLAEQTVSVEMPEKKGPIAENLLRFLVRTITIAAATD